MNKIIRMFSAARIPAVAMVAVFVFFAAVPSAAFAYSIQGSTPGSFSFGNNTIGSNGAGSGSGYNFGDSFQQLIAPFTNFVNSLRGNTTINMGGTQSYMPPSNPGLNFGGGASQAQNMITGWFTQLDNWIYAKTGIRLSGILYVFLSILQWVLMVVLNIVGWLLGLFHQ